MSADVIVARARRWTAVAAVLVVGGCASGAWRWDERRLQHGICLRPPTLPAHRAVERVTLRIRGRELEFVGYRTLDPNDHDVRLQLLLDSGISALDISIHGGEDRRNSGGAFDAVPDFAHVAMEDLRRAWGSRSVFAVKYEPTATERNVPYFRFVDGVTNGKDSFPAEPLSDGSWLAVEYEEYRFGYPLRVTLLSAALVPEATIDYSDFDENRIPREIHLVDLRDGHTLDVEVEEVHLLPMDAAAPAR